MAKDFKPVSLTQRLLALLPFGVGILALVAVALALGKVGPQLQPWCQLRSLSAQVRQVVGCPVVLIESDAAPTTQPKLPDSSWGDYRKAKFQVGEQVLTLEVVTSPAALSQGLSDRTELGSDGMLFVLPQTEVATFWMKQMQFDLDMVWIKDGTVMTITSSVPKPAPETPVTQLPLYSSRVPVNMVLELNAGQAEKWGIVPGTKLELK